MAAFYKILYFLKYGHHTISVNNKHRVGVLSLKEERGGRKEKKTGRKRRKRKKKRKKERKNKRKKQRIKDEITFNQKQKLLSRKPIKLYFQK